MRTEGGFYWLPILPKEFAERTKGLPQVEWSQDLRDEYKLLRAQFTASRGEYASWIRKDRDSRMNNTAKEILGYLLDCLNFDTGRCDPSHQTIADELGMSVRTVERNIPRIAAAGWIAITRRGKTTTNFYRFRVDIKKVANLLDYVDDLRQRRAEAREERKRRQLGGGDPTELADHSHSEPTFVAGHDPTNMAAHDPTNMADKPMKGTSESEPLNKLQGSEVEGPIKVGSAPLDSVPAPGEKTQEGDYIFPAPATETEADQMLAAILHGMQVPPGVELFFRKQLMAGELRKSTVDQQRRLAA